MEAIFSVALIAAPPAFVAGWLLSKSVLRSSVAHPASASGAATRATAPAADSDAPVAETSPTDDKRLVALQNEIALLREGVAERDHQLQNLRQNLKSRPVPPEDTPGTARATARKSLEQLQARLAAREAQIAELRQEMDTGQEKSRRRVLRALVWRSKYRSLLKQLRQQRIILNELREELRQRDLQQQERAAAVARAKSGDALAASLPDAGGAPQVGAVVAQAAAAVAAPVDSAKVGPDADIDPACDLPDDEREDLQTLRGIGPAMHRKLNEHGVYRLRQLALMDSEGLHRLADLLNIGPSQVTRHNWPRQARRLLHMPEPPAVGHSEKSAVAEREPG